MGRNFVELEPEFGVQTKAARAETARSERLQQVLGREAAAQVNG